MKMKNLRGASAIGIIGGADGPTAIYISRKKKKPAVSEGMLRLFTGAAFAAALLVIIAKLAGVRRRRKTMR